MITISGSPSDWQTLKSSLYAVLFIFVLPSWVIFSFRDKITEDFGPAKIMLNGLSVSITTAMLIYDMKNGTSSVFDGLKYATIAATGASILLFLVSVSFCLTYYVEPYRMLLEFIANIFIVNKRLNNISSFVVENIFLSASTYSLYLGMLVYQKNHIIAATKVCDALIFIGTYLIITSALIIARKNKEKIQLSS